MECPTPCICGRIIELHDMNRIAGELPDGGNLVCDKCFCHECDGHGDCLECDNGSCSHYGATCRVCKGSAQCDNCEGRGYTVSLDEE